LPFSSWAVSHSLAPAWLHQSSWPLSRLPGIGDSYSDKINKGRPYKRKDELTYDKMKDQVIAKQKDVFVVTAVLFSVLLARYRGKQRSSLPNLLGKFDSLRLRL
jgi:hypothetical protein